MYDRRLVVNYKLPRRRSKWVVWTPGEHTHVLEWQRRFAVVDALNQDYNSRVQFSSSGRNEYSQEYKEALIRESSEMIRAEWDSLPQKERQVLWPELICTAMVKSPHTAVKVLSATYTSPYPEDYAVADCIDFLIFRFLRINTPPEQQLYLGELLDTLVHLLQNAPSRNLHITQEAIYLLVSHLEPDRIKILYELLDNVNHDLTQDTLIHFTYQLSSSGETDLAFSILKRISNEGEDFNSTKMQSLCAQLLEKNSRPNTTISNSQIFEYMLGCGMKPNLIIYNILLRSSFKGGDYETGWQIYHMMAESGIKADEFTYSILLNDSKLRRDEDALNDVVRLIKESGIRNTYLGTDLLHAILLLTGKPSPGHSSGEYQNTSSPFENMLQLYCEYFDPNQLAHIIPFFEARFGHLISQDATVPRPLPPSPTLHVMLTGLLMDITTHDLIELYSHFRTLVKIRDPAISGAMGSTQVYNSFIMAFGQSMDILDWCPDIIGDMVSVTKRVPSSGGSERGDALGSEHSMPFDFEGPAPDVHTWSILLNAFMSHDQARAAEKVLTMMESRGVTPNQVTWNTLVSGYSRLQDIDMTVNTVDRLEKAGFEPDEFTINGIARIRDNRALIKAMKAKENANLETSLEEKRHRVEESVDKAIIDDEHLHATGKGRKAEPALDKDTDRDPNISPLRVRRIRYARESIRKRRLLFSDE